MPAIDSASDPYKLIRFRAHLPAEVGIHHEMTVFFTIARPELKTSSLNIKDSHTEATMDLAYSYLLAPNTTSSVSSLARGRTPDYILVTISRPPLHGLNTSPHPNIRI
jgi:hypothetical protein